MLSRRATVVVVVALVTIALLAGALPVFASTTTAALPTHARLLSSTPADGASVDTSTEVVLAFNEEVDPTFVTVTVRGPGGDETAGDPQVDGREVTQALASDLAPGEHVVTYRVVSADGHPVSGKLTFGTTVAPSPSGSPTPKPSVTASPSVTPTVDSAVASEEGGPDAWVWVLFGVVVLAALLALATQWKVLGGDRADERADAEADGRPVDAPTNGRDDPFA
jgi:methionine-rich copper-binding protein CopC